MGHSHKKSSNCDLESSQNDVIEQIDGNTEIDDETSNKSLAPEVKNAEVQTEPNLVTVAVKEVAKTYEIFVPLSIRDKIDEELESFWEGININGFSVEKSHYDFSVDISCWELSDSFTASSAASLLCSLPWPDGVSVTRSKPTRYLEKNP
jgi:hypothetical protein